MNNYIHVKKKKKEIFCVCGFRTGFYFYFIF